jgi:hypothetical protein
MSALSGMAVGGIVGFYIGLFTGLAFPEYEAKKYGRKIKMGSTLLAVHTDSADEVKMAESALKKTAALGIRHIEETPRCKPKCSTTVDKKGLKAGTMLLLMVLLSAGAISSARADEVTPVSPTEKLDEQKAKMPPDLATPTISDPARQPGDKTVVQTLSTTQKTTKAKKCKAAHSCRTQTTAK